ncbi:tyrosine-type recombinase/integrase [Niabella sp. W65]|nr:tyrosine-type recombinase/integrase [Niabella sp. W65]MCH7367049.1 tyrosine-type recombinase/integrase [Niabella sp. W65]
MKQGNIQANPMAKIVSPKTNRRLPVFIKEDDVATLKNRAETASESWKTLNEKMLIKLFYATGMRLSELINLRESQVDFSRRQVKVLGKGNKERSLPLNKDILADIQEYITLKRKEFELPAEELIVTEKGKNYILNMRISWLKKCSLK